MEYLTGQKEKEAMGWIDKAVDIAKEATCERAKCGAVIIKAGKIIGKGFNSPPGNDEAERRCHIKKSTYDQKVTDKTCCVHAEQRAIMNALYNDPKKIKGARLYFARFYPSGERRLMGGATKMYCTICTKMMFDVGIIEFVLAHQDGICVYTTSEANQASFNCGGKLK